MKAEMRRLGRQVAMQQQRAGWFNIVGFLRRWVAGHATDASDTCEPVAFDHTDRLHFPTSDVASLTDAPSNADQAPRAPYQLTSSFLGLSGSVSPLGHALADAMARDEAPAALRHVLRVMHHRLLAGLYRVWQRRHLADDFSSHAQDTWSRRLLGYSEGVALPVWQRLRWAPLFGRGGASVGDLHIALRDLLRTYLPASHVHLRQMTGGWQPLDMSQRFRLGQARHALGRTALLGACVRNPTAGVTVTLGPVDGAAWQKLQGEAVQIRRSIMETLKVAIGAYVTADIEIVLEADACPPWTLGASHDALGKASYLARQPGGARVAWD